MTKITELSKGTPVICEYKQGRKPFIGYVVEILSDNAFLLQFCGLNKASKRFSTVCTVTSDWFSINKIDLSTVDPETKNKLDFVLQKIEGRRKKVKKLNIVEALEVCRNGGYVTNNLMTHDIDPNNKGLFYSDGHFYKYSLFYGSYVIKDAFSIEEILSDWEIIKQPTKKQQLNNVLSN